MAAPQIRHYILFFIFIKRVKLYGVHVKMPEVDADYKIKSHLDNPNVILVCSNRDKYCKSNNTNVCAMRIVNSKKTYKNYINSCYLFLSNMCDNPGEEFHIASSGNCDKYLILRRNEIQTTETPESTTTENTNSNNTEAESTEDNDVTEKENSSNENEETTPTILRQQPTTLYPVEDAYDWHQCPRSCPNIYSPECVNVNRGAGKYFKFFTFINHCEGDMYYCKHPKEFAPPPSEEEENIQNSMLSWSHCGSARYLQFSRFVEVTSSMGHFGWLPGKYKATHILGSNERMPGYG